MDVSQASFMEANWCMDQVSRLASAIDAKPEALNCTHQYMAALRSPASGKEYECKALNDTFHLQRARWCSDGNARLTMETASKEIGELKQEVADKANEIDVAHKIAADAIEAKQQAQASAKKLNTTLRETAAAKERA